VLNLLLTTKLYFPSLHLSQDRQKRLEDNLEKELSGFLTLFSAPTGFDKTVLMSEWCQIGRVLMGCANLPVILS
jgi:ATP/maltotriose-dependent transcriptional regulator MalT